MWITLDAGRVMPGDSVEIASSIVYPCVRVACARAGARPALPVAREFFTIGGGSVWQVRFTLGHPVPKQANLPSSLLEFSVRQRPRAWMLRIPGGRARAVPYMMAIVRRKPRGESTEAHVVFATSGPDLDAGSPCPSRWGHRDQLQDGEADAHARVEPRRARQGLLPRAVVHGAQRVDSDAFGQALARNAGAPRARHSVHCRRWSPVSSPASGRRASRPTGGAQIPTSGICGISCPAWRSCTLPSPCRAGGFHGTPYSCTCATRARACPMPTGGSRHCARPSSASLPRTRRPGHSSPRWGAAGAKTAKPAKSRAHSCHGALGD